jgi:hypothetical protein
MPIHRQRRIKNIGGTPQKISEFFLKAYNWYADNVRVAALLLFLASLV